MGKQLSSWFLDRICFVDFSCIRQLENCWTILSLRWRADVRTRFYLHFRNKYCSGFVVQGWLWKVGIDLSSASSAMAVG